MKLHVLPISTESLSRLSLEERVAFLTLGHVANELHMMRKFVLVITNTRTSNKFEQDGKAAYSIMTLKLFAAKVNAGWEFLEKLISRPFFKEIVEDKDVNIGDTIKLLKKYFSHECLIKSVRSRWAAHYDLDEIKAGLERNPGISSSFYMTNQAGNSLYWASEEYLYAALFGEIASQRSRELFDQLIDESNKYAAHLTDCIQGVMIAISKRYFEHEWIAALENSHEIGLVDYEQIQLPYFVDFQSILSE